MVWKDGKIILGSLLLSIVLSWFLSFTGFSDRAENWIHDTVQHRWGETSDFNDIVIIDIDETSMHALKSQLGEWPYDRDVYAAAVEYLQYAGADKIVFDILFSEARQGDDQLLERIDGMDNVYLASILLHDFRILDDSSDQLLMQREWKVENPPELLEKGIILPRPLLLDAAETGIISVFPDADGVVRKLPLVLRIHNRYLPGMMLALLGHKTGHDIRFDFAEGKAHFNERAWPVSDKGEIYLKYPRNMTDLQVIPLYQFLLSIYGEGTITPETFKNKTVFIGSTASILGDYAYIPGTGRVHGLGILALSYHSLKHGNILDAHVLWADLLILLLIVVPVLWLVSLYGIRPIPLVLMYGIALFLAFCCLVWLYSSENIQAWFLTPAIAASLFVVFAIVAKTLSLQFEGQRLLLEKKAAEEARDLKAKFLAHMTHELRTPLTAIMGYNRILQDEEHGRGKQLEFLDVMDKNSEHLLNLINNILDQSQIDAGQMKLVRQGHAIRDLVNEVVTLLKPIADRKGVSIASELSADVPNMLLIDRNRLKQIIINLSGNALKFIEQGGVTVKVDWQDDELEIAVQDTGPGIPEKDLDNIFQAFQQVDTVIASEVKGTGLGLTISTNLARLMDGSISVESELGKGSVFTLRINASSVEVEQDAPQETVEKADEVRLDEKRSGYVLLAEDSPDSSQLIMLFLVNAGHEVRIAADGQQAVEMAADEEPAIILMDMNMPVMNGDVATQQIRSAGYHGQVIALTASTDANELSVMYEAGCNGQLEKPVNPEKLIALVNRYVLLQDSDNDQQAMS